VLPPHHISLRGINLPRFDSAVLEDVVTSVCNEDRYHYGFNGQMKDNEWAGVGNHLEFKHRGYDSRIGRFISVDPITQKYPWYSSYQFVGNTPIQAKDLEGLEPVRNYILNALGAYGNDGPAVKQWTKDVLVPAAIQATKMVGGAVLMATPLFEEEGIELEATTLFVEDATRVAQPIYEPEPVIETPGSTQVQTPSVSTAEGGRASNKLTPDPEATGDHTTFKRGDPNGTGPVHKYQTYEKTKTGYDNPTKRYDGGKPDGSPGASHAGAPTPHVQGKSIPGGVRPAEPSEIPAGGSKPQGGGNDNVGDW